MPTTVVEVGRWLRSRRRDLGVSQAGLGEMVGVRSALVGSWERGESAPTRLQAQSIARALELGPDEIDVLMAISEDTPPAPSPVADIRVDLTGIPTDGPNGEGNGSNHSGSEGRPGTSSVEPVVSLEILGDSGDPWVDSPPPRAVLIPPTSSAPVRVLHQGVVPPDLTALRRSAASVDLAGVERRRRQNDRVRRRALDRDRRIAVRDEVAKRRRQAQAAYRSKVEQERAEAASGPGSSYELGSVFPMPARSGSVERVTYSTAEPTFESGTSDRLVYLSRRLRVVLVLIALGALLVWAVAELGDGWSAVIDLLTGGGAGELVDDTVGGATGSVG